MNMNMNMTSAGPKGFISVLATATSFGVTDIAQLIAVCVGIISGIMAIRHYATATKLSKMKIKDLSDKQKYDALNNDD